MNAIRLGSSIGEVLEVEDPVVDGRVLREFMRVRVWIDVAKPLIDGIWVPRPNRERIWLSVKYEKLQNFCYKCGVIEHEYRDCRKVRILSNRDAGKPKYGNWFGVAPVKTLRQDT